ncbi:hypothetical protein [Frondihabitans sp. 762G35]|uniref:hypothetical protein n=1 Tax=Frondihabitans sp. 762G35 TaxID=1446794 RepID=UPI000F4D3269|nr:hypothetical protein [Frondihabitans sp. 762G35]
MTEVDNVTDGNATEKPRWTWRRVAGVAAVVLGVLAVLESVVLAWSLQGISEPMDRPLHFLTEAGGVTIVALPLTIVIVVGVALVAGTEPGRARRLGIIAGLVAVATFPVFYVAAALFPVRN